MNREANLRSRPAIWVVLLFLAGSVWNCATVRGEAQVSYPADGAVIAGLKYEDNIYTYLEFIPGASAVKHTGYFSGNYDDVANRIEDANLGEPPYPTRYYVGLPLIPPANDTLVRGTTYYWTVDETDADGKIYPGDIWEFTIRDFKATFPNPPNEALDVETTVLLSWQPGAQSYCRSVYIGTSWDDVNNAVYNDYLNPPPEFLATVLEPNILVTDLAYGVKYYWRVDEIYGRCCGMPFCIGPYYKGDVWSFTTVRGEAQPEFPADGAVIDGSMYGDNIYTRLEFIPGATAVEHTGYFNEDYSKVENRAEDANLGPPPFADYPGSEYFYYVGLPPGLIPGDPYPESLVRGTKYYWTVDERDAQGNTYPGEIWEFTILDFYAFEPSPPNEAVDVETTVLLSWQPGYGPSQHYVLMGTSWEDVNNAFLLPFPPPELLCTVSEPNVFVTGLEFNTTYYWRVDEALWLPPPGGGFQYIYKGGVWCFTTVPQRIYVDMDAGGSNNGTSWENAYNYLQDALIEAESVLKPVEIRVAEGIYKPDRSTADPNGSGSRGVSFVLIDGVTIKGGYAGFGEPDPNARDIEAYETILSGDLDGNDVDVNDPIDLLDEPTRAENSYHVVTGDRQDWPDMTVVVDGFTITGGNSNGDFPTGERMGGGMNFCSGKIINCTITGNSAMWGGGMCYSMGEIINCNIKRNFVSGRGGGISYSDVQMINCTISENSAIQGGGGINNTAGDMMMTNCIFKGNTAREGGAIWYIDGKFGVQTLVNCTFSGNLAEMGGGAIYLSDYSNPTLINCILWGNSYPEIHGSAVVTYSDVEGGWPGDGNIDADPCFVDVGGGDLRLSSDSPCIDTGYNNAPNLGATDMDGHPRIIDGDCNGSEVVDMGAYEFNYVYLGDFDYNCEVDFADFSIIALAWLTEPADARWDPLCNISTTADSLIDWRDLRIVCENWLAGK